MKKFAVFTEGQGELIFVRHLLFQIIGYEHLSVECFALRSGRLLDVPYKYETVSAKVHVMVVNVGNDEKVLSAIAGREERLVGQGYEIIGLRDMYSR